MKHDDDDELIPWEGDLPPRIDPGEYRAIVLSTKKVNRFGLTTMETRWRLLLPDSREKIELPSFCNLGPTKHPKIRAGSKLASWQRAVAEFTHGTASKVTMKSFKEFWFRVLVRTAMRNAQGPLHERDQYSVVDDILSVGGKLTDLPVDGLPPPIETAGPGYPAFIHGFGPLKKDALNRCESCEALTAFSYGSHPLCPLHARQHAHEEGQG
jgi:hypothetical protein